MLWFVANWKYIVIGVMAVTIAVLTNRLVASYKDNGVVSAQLKNANDGITVLRAQLKAADTKFADQATREANDFTQCQAAAVSSDSAAFRKGVDVGKILGRKQQCETQLSPQPSTWPQPPAQVVPLTKAR